MSLDPFVLLRVDHGEVAGVSASVDQAEQAVVTVQSQGVYLYNVREAEGRISKFWVELRIRFS